MVLCFGGSNQLDTVLSQALNPPVHVLRLKSSKDKNKSEPGAYISNTIITNTSNPKHTYVQDTLELNPPLQTYCW